MFSLHTPCRQTLDKPATGALHTMYAQNSLRLAHLPAFAGPHACVSAQDF